MKCEVCEKDNIKIMFIPERTWCGTSKLPDEFFRKSEFSLGWDYYAKFDLKQCICIECGYVWYEEAFKQVKESK